MSKEDWDDEDAWADDEDDLDENESANCPECGQTAHSVADKCPNCGYWLSDADRRAMWSGATKPMWLRVTAWVVLVAFLFTLLAVGFTLF
jgi:ribosomal protein L37E